MSRRSKRELERAIEQLDAGESRESTSPLETHYPSNAVRVVRAVVRDLLRIRHRNPEAIVNAPEPDATLAFLEIVRERYGIEADHDDDVRNNLANAATGHDHSTPVDIFAMAPVEIAKHTDVEMADGEGLETLVETGREETAKRLLVRRTYDAFADTGGQRAEVAV